MKIKRNGVEIELTPSELRQAYEEQRDNDMRADISSILLSQGRALTPSQMDDALHLYKKGMESDDWVYAVENAISEVYDPLTAPTVSLEEWLNAWVKSHGISKENKPSFWELQVEMAEFVKDSCLFAERRANFESDEDFTDWFYSEFEELAKPILKASLGYTDIEMAVPF